MLFRIHFKFPVHQVIEEHMKNDMKWKENDREENWAILKSKS